jgi:organic hydroperoxide reductase OsmC/OhrA
MEKIEKLYTATASATGGRNGHVKSSDAVLDLDVRTPRELGGGGGWGVTPEQAKSLTEKAHQVCPYSNATRNNIEVELVNV